MTSEFKVGDKVKTYRGYRGKIVMINKMAALIDIGLPYLIREPLYKLTKLKGE